VSTVTGGSAACWVPSSGDGDRRLGQQLEQERLELVVGAVHLIDQQHGRARARVQQRGEQRPRQQVLAGEQVLVLDPLAGRLGQPDGEQLARVVPLVQRLVGGDALIALQADQRGVDRGGQGLGGLGLAHPGSPSSRIGCPIRTARNSAAPSWSPAR
jgi:hypothetical protein